MTQAKRRFNLKITSALTLFFFLLNTGFSSPSFAQLADSSNNNLIPTATTAEEAAAPSTTAAHVDQLNDVAALQQNNPVPAALPAAPQPQTIDTTMPVAIPEFLVTLSNGNSYIYTPTLSKTSFDDQYVKAQVTYLGNDQWKLDITAKQDISQVWFPWESNRKPLSANVSDEMFYYPYLSGITEKADNKDTPNAWGWSQEYPGSIFAPLVVMATDAAARMVAALNWPPKKVRPVYGAERMGLVYDSEVIKANTSASFGALITQVNADVSKGEVPWQMALDKYRTWLDPKMGDVEYSDWMWKSEGFIEYGLMNQYHAPGTPINTQNIIDNVEAILNLWGDDLDQVQFWGQMGGYAGKDPAYAAEQGNCCGLSQTLYSGYGSSFIDFVNQLVQDGYHAGFYSAPHYATDSEAAWNLDTPEGYAWLQSWLDKNQNEYGANSFYIDVLGRGYFGDPGYVMSLFDTLIPQDSIIEGMVDIYAAAGLISGSLNGGDWGGGPGNTPENSAKTTFANFGRYLLNDRIVYLGSANGDHVFWGKYNDYWSERQVFLLGAKFDAGVVNERNPDGSPVLTADGSLVRDEMMDHIIRLRDSVDWWDRRPEYLDTKGLTNIPAGIDIRRFQDKDGKDLIVVDNWNQIAGQSFYMDGVRIFISSDKISIIDVQKVTPGAPGDATHDGKVDGADYTVWMDEYGKEGVNSAADFNRDGKVDGADYTILADHTQYPLVVPGDATGDGKVDGADYTVWMDDYNKQNTNSRADFNHDGKVDGADYTIMADHFLGGAAAMPQTVPANSPAPVVVTPAAPLVNDPVKPVFPILVSAYVEKLKSAVGSGYDVALSENGSADYPYTISVTAKMPQAAGLLESATFKVNSSLANQLASLSFFNTDMSQIDTDVLVQSAKKLPAENTDILTLLTQIKITGVDAGQYIYCDYQGKPWALYKKLSVVYNAVNIEGLEKVDLNFFDKNINKTMPRFAWVHVPANYDPSKPVPMVLNFHGGYGDSLQEMDTTGMNALADEQGFIVVYPEGVGTAWNAVIPAAGLDDIGFINALLDSLEAKYTVDTNAVFVTGISNGGQIAYKAAAELPDRIAAVAVVSSGINNPSDFNPSSPVSVMVIHGTDDPRIPFNGGFGTGTPVDYMSNQDLIHYIVGLDAASAVPADYVPYEGFSPNSDVSSVIYEGKDADVVSINIKGGGHTWPDGKPNAFLEPTVGATSQAISANEAIYKFFMDHKKKAPAVIQMTPDVVTEPAVMSHTDMVHSLIDNNFFTQAQYDAFIQALPFDAAYAQLTEDDTAFLNVLIAEGLLKPEITDLAVLKQKLSEKGIDMDALKLKGDGILSAASLATDQGFNSLLAKDSSGKTLTPEQVKAKLKALYDGDKTMFLNALSDNSFLELLGASNDGSAPSVSPIVINTWAKVSGADVNTNFILNPVVLLPTNAAAENSPVDMLVDYPGTAVSGSQLVPQIGSAGTGKPKTIAEIAAEINKLPEGSRNVMLHSYSYYFLDDENLIPDGPNGQGKYGPVLDALRDENGNVIRAADGSAYLFPSLDKWAERTAARIDAFLSDLKNAGAQIDYVIYDYEDAQNVWWYTGVNQFLKDYWDKDLNGPGKGGWKVANVTSILLKDPRMKTIMKDLNLTENDINTMYSWGWNSEKQVKWDAYMAAKTKEALDTAFNDPIHKYFPDAVITNYGYTVSTNTTPNGWGQNSEWATLGLLNHSDGTLPNDGIYGQYSWTRWGSTTQYDSSGRLNANASIMDVPAPYNFFTPTATAYYTAYNDVMSNIAQLDATDLSTDLDKRHWVTTPTWAKGMLGPQTYDVDGKPKIVFNSSTGMFEGGEDLGNRMAEIWYRAAASDDVMNFWDGSSTTYTTPDDVVFAQRTMKEINQMMGYSDKKVIDDAWVELNGVPQAVGPQHMNMMNDISVWGVQADGKNLYRVVLDLPKGTLREATVVNDGTNGQPVEIKLGNSVLKIKGAKIVHPAEEVSLMGFWVEQDTDPNKLLRADVDSIEKIISVPRAVNAYAENLHNWLPSGFTVRVDSNPSNPSKPYKLTIENPSAAVGSLKTEVVEMDAHSNKSIKQLTFNGIDSALFSTDVLAHLVAVTQPNLDTASLLSLVKLGNFFGSIIISYNNNFYRATGTAGLTQVPSGMDIQRLRDKDGKDLVLISNPSKTAGLFVMVNNQKIFIPESALSLIDIQKAAPKAAGDANWDGRVDDTDYQIWLTDSKNPVLNSTADFNRDGKVDAADLDIWNMKKIEQAAKDYAQQIDKTLPAEFTAQVIPTTDVLNPYRVVIEDASAATGTVRKITVDIGKDGKQTISSVDFSGLAAQPDQAMLLKGLKMVSSADPVSVLSQILISNVERDQTIHFNLKGENWAIYSFNGNVMTIKDVSAVLQDYVGTIKSGLSDDFGVVAYRSAESILVIYRKDTTDLVSGEFSSAFMSLDENKKVILKGIAFQDTVAMADPALFLDALKQISGATDPVIALTQTDILRVGADQSVYFEYQNKPWKYQKTASGPVISEVKLGDANGDGIVNGSDYIIWAENAGAASPNLAADFNFDGFVNNADYDIWAANYAYDRWLPGDADHNGKVDGSDYTLWANNNGKAAPDLSADFNFDGKVDKQDYNIWYQNFNYSRVVPGDANHDGNVNGADYTIWASQINQPAPNPSADFNFDGRVDGADYTVWAANYNKKITPAPLSYSALGLRKPANAPGLTYSKQSRFHFHLDDDTAI